MGEQVFPFLFVPLRMLQPNTELVQGTGLLLTAAAQVTWSLKDVVAACQAQLDDANKQLETAESDLQCFIAAAEAKRVDPTPFIRRRELKWNGPIPSECLPV